MIGSFQSSRVWLSFHWKSLLSKRNSVSERTVNRAVFNETILTRETFQDIIDEPGFTRYSSEGKTQFNCMNLQVECVLAFVSNYILILRSQNSLYICTKFTFLSLERYLNFPSYFENVRSCALCNNSISWSQQKPKPTNPNSSHFQKVPGVIF